MGNWDIAISDKYWHDTYLESTEMITRSGVGVEGAPDDPPRFRGYPGIRLCPLPQRIPDAIGSLADAFLDRPPRITDPGVIEGHTLGTLLYYGYGLARVDMGPVSGWPYHRTVPSARCFYPTELYLWLPDGPDFAAGVYHYDQLHHALVPLRDGDHRELIGDAVDADLAGASAVLILTSHLWKTAFRYRDYAFRLCTQEAGMVAGNLLMVASALGLTGAVHFRFLDEVLDRLVCLTEGEEQPLAVLPLHAAKEKAEPASLLAGLAERRARLRTVPADLGLAGATYEMAVNSRIGDLGELQPIAAAPGPDLARALRERNSGGTFFKPTNEPVDAEVLHRLADAMLPYRSDTGSAPMCRLYVIVQHVTGVEPGVYRLPDMDRVTDLQPDRLGLGLGPPVMDMRSVNVLCYPVSDRREMTTRFGNRGFGVANADAGVVTQRLCVLAGAAGLAARPVNGYHVPAVQNLLGITDPALLPMFQVGIGHRNITAQYEMPIIF
ncbi:SagB family peptide dehydrogenase [Spongiactinospora sp. TRM90649]|uniref:SagB family peptide dehydrogenase n=1 Tax=Spongiactinospora sp. TRM90649 TaxID=3031114 RepID=UPI0023FA236D|nr:SagB family peptide dehydrogenase [Spongiactinospora sp. TRM90649]MDF5756348.1 SagB family peptide dehydrogenase [Spongiactinospora sp. TRM90649]